jgi:ABC-type multidrug transport system ATPase subunit
MGASASGKSVLMQVLAGRLPKLHITGEVTLGGIEIDINDPNNSIDYVPQDDFLMGELTPRETLRNNARMKKNTNADFIDKDVDTLLKKFGLDHVADNPIGTVFVRGLSGGQRKRVEVCSELISPHSVLMLDEPTSGLDGAIAYDVLHATRKILQAKKGELSLMISIHQPNSRILELFDNILLIGGGGMIFFGTLAESIQYFSSIGFPAPEVYTPTDVFLQVSDANFGENHDFDFEGSFACSKYATKLTNFLNEVKRLGVTKSLHAEVLASSSASTKGEGGTEWRVVKVRPGSPVTNPVPDVEEQIEESPIKEKGPPTSSLWLRQYWTLLYRDFTLAYRDPSLYYLQFMLVSAFGFLVGATFFKQHAVINAKMTNINGGLLWIVLMMAYIQVFKVYHLSRSNKRFMHEVTNKTYNIFAYWLAELTASAVLLITFIPGTIVAYFMMQLPSEAYPFLLFLYWLVSDAIKVCP